jgi:hypothetical protein
LIGKNNSVSDYESYIAECEQLGIRDIRLKTDMMLTLDFIIANTDRHYNNFGLIRDAQNLDWIGVAPIYDSGTSMWCNSLLTEIKPLDGELPSKPFRSKHLKQIELVSDFSWLDLTLLDGIESDFAAILGNIYANYPELKERNALLCRALRQRVDLLSRIAKPKNAGA